MRIMISAFGTRGDVQPMIALSQVLRGRGHEVRLFIPPNFEAWAKGLGLDAVAVGLDFEKFIAEHGENVWGAIPTVRREIRSRTAAMLPYAERADVYLSSAVCVASAVFAERFRRPGRYIMFSPSVLESGDYPSPMTRWQRLPRALNRLSWKLEKKAWNFFFLESFNEVRRATGAPETRDVWASIWSQGCIIAAERKLAEPGREAPPLYAQTGAWFFEDPLPVPAEVEEFLGAGPPPVFIGFGSMTDSRPAETLRRLLEAVRRAGVRALVARGWAGLGGVELPPEVLLVGPTPHARIFPRCSAVLHHGGAGTTHQALRAGVPQIVAPHLMDQFFWSDRLERAGVSPGRIRRSSIDPDGLARLLRLCVEDGAMRERSRELGSQVALDGLQKTVELIEGLKEPVKTGS